MKSIVVHDWAALAPGLTSAADWLAWAGDDAPAPLGAFDALPPADAMPAMLRRRMGLTGRLACAAAFEADDGAQSQFPLVFASRYGDAARALESLGELVRGQGVSPTAFTMGVHNAIGALYAIARGHTANMQVVTGGCNTLRAALHEVMGLLADGASQVLLVSYDTPLPSAYACFHGHHVLPHAWAWRIAVAPADAQQALRLAWSAQAAADGFEEAVGRAKRIANPLGNPSLALLWQFLRTRLSQAVGAQVLTV